MIEILCQMMLEEDHKGIVGIRFHAHHAGVHASKKELALVNTIINAMKATTALAAEVPIPAYTQAREVLALPNGSKKVSKRRLKKGKRKWELS
jgi:hypothetical protein